MLRTCFLQDRGRPLSANHRQVFTSHNFFEILLLVAYKWWNFFFFILCVSAQQVLFNKRLLVLFLLFQNKTICINVMYREDVKMSETLPYSPLPPLLLGSEFYPLRVSFVPFPGLVQTYLQHLESYLSFIEKIFELTIAPEQFRNPTFTGTIRYSLLLASVEGFGQVFFNPWAKLPFEAGFTHFRPFQ